MDKNKPTLAIYGIQDRNNFEHPLYVHDHNLAIMNKGKVLHFLQQERITRRKRDNTLHIHLKSILKDKKLIGEDYDLVFVDNVVGRTFLTQSGEVRFEAPLNKELALRAEKGKCWWFGNEKEAYVLNHELAHIFSCLPFFGKFKDNSLLVHFDGGASMSNFSACILKNEQFDWVEYSWDLKPFSAIFNANALVFSILGAKLPEQNAVPGKFMGFAGLGKSRPELMDWLARHDYFGNIWSNTSVFFKQAKEDWGIDLRSFDQRNPFIQDTAASLQDIFVNKILEKLILLKKKTGAENLYYTGGSALNIVANTKIIESNLFKNVYIPPCTEDSGLALGAAAFAEWEKHGKAEIHSPYLNNWGVENYQSKDLTTTVKEVAECLMDNKIVGICNGMGEAGPRALGNRSILALANSKKLSKIVSMRKKGREWYRPLAPVALERNVKYFTGKEKIHLLARFMLMDFSVLPQKQRELEGALHADGTARFQSISDKNENPFIFELLEYLDKHFSIKALINTSFNSRGEPMVHTEKDAITSSVRMGLDAVVINGEFRSCNMNKTIN